jgi:hypothetical protein
MHEEIYPERDLKINGKPGDILPQAEYVTRFSRRYRQNPVFREMVHRYLELTNLDRIKIRISRRILPRWYESRTETLIDEYARDVRAKVEEAYRLREDLDLLRDEHEEATLKSRIAEDAEKTLDKVGEHHKTVDSLYRKTVSGISSAYQAGIFKVADRVKDAQQQVIARTDVKRLVAQQLRAHIEKTGLIAKDEHGNLGFDEDQIVKKLEEIFLEEIVEGIESDQGGGFLSDMKRTYDGVISHWAELDDIVELPRAEWVQSTIYSRTKGFVYPQFPYLIVPKMEDRTRVSIDTAIMVDTSNSMNTNQKIVYAKKTALAAHALMRRLNPHNSTYLAHYNTDIHQVSASEFIRSVNASGWTRTDLAIQWLVEKLKDSGPSIAYLITDGVPEDQNVSYETMLKKSIAAANAFRDYPYIRLRIFLVDMDKNSAGNIREIGRAAGPDTKVIPIKYKEMGKDVIKDLSRAIGEMYSISRF